MLQVVQFSNTFAPMVGGIEKSVAQFCTDLNQLGHLCRIVTPAFEGAGQSREGVLRVPAIKGIGEKGFSLRLPAWNLVEHWMDAIDPQLVHAHQPFMLGDTAWRVARDRRIPLVFTHHTLYERYALDWPILEQQKAEKLLLELTSRFANRCDLCLAPTHSVAQIMRERGIGSQIEVVPTGIDVERFRRGDGAGFRRRFGIPADAVVIGHLGRLTAAKNIDFLLDAIIDVLRQQAGVWLLLVGDGESRSTAVQRFENAGVGDRLVTPGNLFAQSVVDAYKAMDLFCFTSKSDTQGIVLAEAMAAEIPIVALDAPGARDCLLDRYTGLLLPGNVTSTQMAAEIIALLRAPNQLALFRSQLREHAQQFDHQRCARRLVRIYADLINDYSPKVSTGGETEWNLFIEKIEREWHLLSEKLAAARRAIF